MPSTFADCASVESSQPAVAVRLPEGTVRKSLRRLSFANLALEGSSDSEGRAWRPRNSPLRSFLTTLPKSEIRKLFPNGSVAGIFVSKLIRWNVARRQVSSRHNRRPGGPRRVQPLLSHAGLAAGSESTKPSFVTSGTAVATIAKLLRGTIVARRSPTGAAVAFSRSACGWELVNKAKLSHGTFVAPAVPDGSSRCSLTLGLRLGVSQQSQTSSRRGPPVATHPSVRRPTESKSLRQTATKTGRQRPPVIHHLRPVLSAATLKCG